VLFQLTSLVEKMDPVQAGADCVGDYEPKSRTPIISTRMAMATINRVKMMSAV
jgi:hypothetical protein